MREKSKRLAMVHLQWGGEADVTLKPDNSYEQNLSGIATGDIRGRVEAALKGVCTKLVDGWPHAGKETLKLKIFADDGRTIDLGSVEVLWGTYAETPPPYCGWFIWKNQVGQWGVFVTEDGMFMNNIITVVVPID